MKFEIIPNEQTPNVPPMGDVVEFINSHLVELNAFLLFASEQRTAVGLAANQTSADGERFMQRVFALLNNDTGEWRLIINPVIDEYIGMKELKNEGCLTWEGMRVIAERHRAVRVSYYNTEGQKITGEIYTGFNAQVWQHEINHLNGVVERIEPRGFRLPEAPEPERNEACPCGSGKKYKKCCYLYT